MRVSFSKYEGLGNDFIVIDAAPELSLSAASAVALCDRHRGIGADGVLLVGGGASGLRMDVINADGSVPEMCGNGIRCAALHLSRKGQLPGADVTIDTASGPHPCRVLRGGDDGLVEVAMRPASLLPQDIGLQSDRPWIDAPLIVGDARLRVTAVSMGNPHAVSFDDVGERARVLGPMLGAHARFEHGVNAGFAQWRGPRQLKLAVYERGVGWTEACGTGACAAAVAAVETGRAQRGLPLEVTLPGGTLQVTVTAPGERIAMTGPARHVFDGALELPR